jgi:hypothetical protein
MPFSNWLENAGVEGRDLPQVVRVSVGGLLVG